MPKYSSIIAVVGGGIHSTSITGYLARILDAGEVKAFAKCVMESAAGDVLRWVSAFLELIPVSCNKKPYLAACEQLGNGMFFVLLYKAMSEKQNWINTARAMK